MGWGLLFLILLAALVTASTVAYRLQRTTVKEGTAEELSAIAELKVGQIRHWYEERLADIATISYNRLLTATILDFLSDPYREDLRSGLTSLMEDFLRHFDYRTVFLLDAAGNVVLSAGEAEPLGDYAREEARKAAAAGVKFFSDLHTGEGGDIHFDLMAPLAESDRRAAGMVLFRIDPYRYFYPLIQTWPGSSPTAETLLVRREGDEVLYLNELRFLAGSALTLRRPLGEESLPEAVIARGEEGAFEGRDYRGERVMAVIRAVPDTGWYLVAKKDLSEVYHRLAVNTWMGVSLGAFSLLALCLLLFAVWARRRGRFYRESYEMARRLQESEERYRLVFEHTPIGIFFYDSNLVVTDCNERFAEILGSTRERLIGLDMHGLRDQGPVPAIAEAVKGREGRFVGYYVSTTGTGRIWASLRTAPLRDREGRVIGGVGIVEDITERMRMQRELEERELFLRRLTDNMLDLISQIDAEGRFIYLSPSNQRVLGYRPEELLGTHVFELVHPEDLQRVREAYSASEKELRPGRVEFRARRADGGYVWVESVGNPLIDEEGNPQGAIFVTRDITERKRMQERLERLNRCFLGLGTEPLRNIVSLVDTAREILEVPCVVYGRLDQGRYQVYLSTHPSLTGDDGTGGEAGVGAAEKGAAGAFREVENPEDAVCYRVVREQRDAPVCFEDLAPGEALGFDIPPGVWEPRSFLGYPVRVEGRVMGCLGGFRDRPGDFEPESAYLLGMVARAVAGEEARLAHQEELRDFMNIASHELRHPMTIIKGYTSTLRKYLERMDREAVRSILGDIEDGVDKLERMVHQLLDTARMERGRFVLEIGEVDVVGMAAAILEEARARWPENTFSMRAADGLPAVRADEEKLRQVVVILLENAVKYSPPGSPVEVEVSHGDEGGVVLSVLDRGPGIAEGEREKVFERFYQADGPGRRPSHGLGLGLYIARRIVEAHGGRLWHEPREGGGSAFRFTIKAAMR
ncbi:PAS domain S-box protein [Candidatus Solincola tengchongensis]|uniref:PAS domain S-box protein n=1 Tax=Candidatus Solincola tengchongensis TaxID=2900693 RepID=UPI00257B37C6|nr:PAS domain S-box protein [Candidatus Solincola tengchongensis]